VRQDLRSKPVWGNKLIDAVCGLQVQPHPGTGAGYRRFTKDYGDLFCLKTLPSVTSSRKKCTGLYRPLWIIERPHKKLRVYDPPRDPDCDSSARKWQDIEGLAPDKIAKITKNLTCTSTSYEVPASQSWTQPLLGEFPSHNAGTAGFLRRCHESVRYKTPAYGCPGYPRVNVLVVWVYHGARTSRVPMVS